MSQNFFLHVALRHYAQFRAMWPTHPFRVSS